VTTVGLRLTLHTGETGAGGGTVALRYTRVDTGEAVRVELPSRVPCGPWSWGCEPQDALEAHGVDTFDLELGRSITIDDDGPAPVRDIAFEYVDAWSGWDFAGFVLEAVLEDDEFDLSIGNNPTQVVCEGADLVSFTESGSYVPESCP
jgi:hypothetical protein